MDMGQHGIVSRLLGIAMVLAIGVPVAVAQDYPSRPISILVAFGPGGSTDTLARLVAQGLGDKLKMPVIIENKPGGNQTIAIETLKTRPADGYTLYVGTGSSMVQYPALRKELRYHPLQDFALVSMLALQPGVLSVSPGSQFRNVAELVAYAKANPGKLNYGSQGVGSASHLAMEYFMARTGTAFTHIPLKSDSDIGLELAAGRLDVAFMTTLAAVPLMEAGRQRILVTTSRHRLPSLPDLLSLADAGVPGLDGLDPLTFYGIVAREGTPAAIVATLNRAIVEVMNVPGFTEKLRINLRVEPMTDSPEGFHQFLKDETAKWTAIGDRVNLDTN
jgi:tripartite-type tricarboxylate transporter receptor subunit TctC